MRFYANRPADRLSMQVRRLATGSCQGWPIRIMSPAGPGKVWGPGRSIGVLFTKNRHDANEISKKKLKSPTKIII